MKLDLRVTAILAASAVAAGALGAATAQAQERAAAPPPAASGRPAQQGPGFFKVPDYPAGAFSAGSTLAHSPLQKEWVDIPYAGKTLHTWIEYPAGTAPAGVVIVMSHEAGLDDWMRAIADQLAAQGFIAVAPDILSGLGPGGGGIDSFRFTTDVIRANARLSQDEVIRRYKAAFDYAKTLPRANGKVASLGIGMGGADSFRFAAEVSPLNGAVVFYGVSPGEDALARVSAPVLGLYGEDDTRVMRTVTAATAAMKRLGKVYDVHVYPNATQAFLRSNVEGQNAAAESAAWPAAIGFLRQHLN